MVNENVRYDLTSADSKIIGFDFQYFYFINELLNLDIGQSIGFEAKDDIHITTLLDGKEIIKLFQLKHTVQKNTSNASINLTDKDYDLWKSLSNWCEIICDKADKRETSESQLHYLKYTEFILATNKNISTNKFISIVKKHKNKNVFKEVKNYLIGLEKNTKDEQLKSYIQTILKLDSNVLDHFIEKLKFIDTGDCIIENIKENIQKKMILSYRVNDVFNDLFSELKQDFFKIVKTGKHQIITYKEWIKNYTYIFEKQRTTNFPIREFKPVFPKDLSEQPFIKELIEIDEIKDDDIAQIADLSNFMLNVKMNLDKWCEDGDITKSELEKFHKEIFYIWKNIHKKSHRTTYNLMLDHKNALNCLDEVRTKELKICGTDLGIPLSNGEFYYLSNKEEIGWKIEWEKKY